MTRTSLRGLRAALLCGAATGLSGTLGAAAQTEVGDARSTAVVTSADGATTITADGSVTVQGGTAVTIDSDDEVTNDGAITVEGEDDGAIGVLITGDRTGGFTQSGSITIASETEPPRAGAPVPLPTGRFGVLLSGDARLTGDITFSAGATVVVDGDGAAGLGMLGTLDGDLTIGGVAVRGEDATGVLIGGVVTGDVTAPGLPQGVPGRILALGEGASGVVVDDGARVDGRLTVSREVSVSPLTDLQRFEDDGNADNDLTRLEERALRGGNAVRIRGDVGGGVLFGGATAAVEDADGNTVSPALGGAVLTSRGASTTVVVDGGTVLGALTGAGDAADGFSLYNGGAIGATPDVIGLSATAVAIQDAVLAGGLGNGGTITAVASGRDAEAVAISFGADAQVARFVNTGALTASVSSDIGDAVAFRDASGTVTSFRNTGTIGATLRDFVDADPCAELADRAACTDADRAYDDEQATGTAIAVDLSANTTGITFENEGLLAGAVRLGSGSDDILFDAGTLNGALDTGDGDDALRLVNRAVVSGAISLGGGFDTVSLEEGGVQGDLDFGAGGGLFGLSEGSVFRGGLDAAQVDVTVGDRESQIWLDRTGANVVGSLTTLASGGDLLDENGVVVTDEAGNAVQRGGAVLTFLIGQGDEGVAFFDVAGDAIIADDTEFRTVFAAAFSDQSISAPIIRAGGVLDVDLSGGRAPVALGLEPFLFSQSLSIDAAQNALVLTLDRKSASEVGLNDALAPAYEPFIAALAAASDPSLGASGRAVGQRIFNLTDEASFNDAYRQFLPGPLQAPLAYARAQNNSVASLVTQRVDRLREDTGARRTAWLQEESFFVNRGSDDVSNGFDGGGFVIAAGVDAPVGPLDTLGATVSIASARYDEQEGEDFPFNRLTYAVGAYAAERIGAVRLDGRVAYGVTSSESERSVLILARDEEGRATGLGDIQRRVDGSWDGSEISAYGRVLYEGRYGDWDVQPFASLDYLRLEEDAYEEAGGFDEAVALGVDDREAESLRGNVGVILGREYALRPNRFDTTIPGAVTPRITAAYSTELNDDPLSGTYRFLQGDADDGDAFTLEAEKEGGVGILGADIVYENQYAKLTGGGSVAVGEQSEIYTLRVGVGLKW